MSVQVRLPGGERVSAAGTTVAEVIDDLERQRPGTGERLIDESGLRRYVNVYVGAADVRYGDGLATSVPSGAEVTILPAGAPEGARA